MKNFVLSCREIGALTVYEVAQLIQTISIRVY